MEYAMKLLFDDDAIDRTAAGYDVRDGIRVGFAGALCDLRSRPPKE